MKHKTQKQQQVFTTFSVKQTKLLGAVLAKELLKTPLRKHAVVFGLQGVLGSGKTSFVQGFAKGLGIKEKILSPTFVIMKSYPFRRSEARPAKRGGKLQRFYHIDCYRIKDEQDLLSLGWDKIVSDPQNLVLIEWPERIQKILPKDTISISFETIKASKAHKRKITFS